MAKIVTLGLVTAVLFFVLVGHKNNFAHDQPEEVVSGKSQPEAISIQEKSQSGKSALKIKSYKNQWSALSQNLRRLDSLDQVELDQLYEQAKTIIQNQKSLDAFSNSLSEFANTDLKNSFFTISAWLRYSGKPDQVVEAVLNYAPQRVQAYAVREMRKQFEAGTLGLSEVAGSELVKTLTAKAATEKSLNVSLEIFQLLNDMHESSSVQSALAGHSERDQKLIREVLEI